MKNRAGIFKRIVEWEAWPFEVLYFPLTFCWLWYILRSRSFWFFTPSNPKITFGGLEGEPKKEMYDLLPKENYPTTFYVLPTDAIEVVEERLKQYDITYPFIVKPEVGGQGILLRKINTPGELKHYHAHMPWEYIVQSLVSYPMEVSVFYIRYPNKLTGTVTGFLHKIPMYVTGNGKDSVGTLVQQHPKGQKRFEELKAKHSNKWDEILQADERYMLSYAANHNRGAKFIDLKDEIDDDLVKVFDKFSLRINDFFYGRYDIMCESVADLKQGKNFTILEYNGCGAEPNHFYDTGYTLLGAYKEILRHWKALFEISRYNRQKGIAPWPFTKGRKFIAYTRKLMKEMIAADEAMG